jgi:adenosylcobinamide hydrolase
MRYFVDNNTLFIRGTFRAASTGIGGGIETISTIINHTVPSEWNHDDPIKELELVAAKAGIWRDYFGLLTAVPMQNLCVLQYDFVTVFITAGLTPGKETHADTINIVACSSQGMSDAALLETIMIATEAKAEALRVAGKGMSGTPTDAVITACEGEYGHEYAGTLTAIGKRVYSAVLYGIGEALARDDGTLHRDSPGYYIFSRFKGDHWVEWTPENCQYYPCHFAGQRCDFCYCPLYPCGDESLGQWAESSNGGKVWNCSQCTLLHESRIADYLKRYPEASKDELVRLRDAKREAT